MGLRIVRREPGMAKGALPPDLHPVVARLYRARQVVSAAELDYSLGRLLPFQRLSGIDAAVDLLAAALAEGQRILVVGDFDADGATSCAVVVRGLRLMGFPEVDYLVPNRFEFGYGLTPEIVAIAAQREPGLLITVDNGISSVEGVAAAAKMGMRVLVTDHHLPGQILPAADAIVNPNLPQDGFPCKSLAGVGVAFYVLLALRAHLREAGWFGRRGPREPNLGRLLDLVALGTVADVVPLDHTNRVLVDQGLRRIRAGNGQPGIRALLRIGGRDETRAVAGDLGFAAGPRLNAAGRLNDMSLGIECLLADDEDTAHAMAAQLDGLNRDRRLIEAQMQEQAQAQLAALDLDSGADRPFGLCIHDEQWHQGVIGILAARVRERSHRPVIAFAPGGDGELKGSGRSVDGLHLRDALDAVAARYPGLLVRFGGHAKAAGLTLRREDLETFSRAFDQEVRRCLGADQLEGTVLSDGEIEPGDLGLPLAEQLREAGPWGQSFPEPVFDGRFEVCQSRVVGEHHLKLTLKQADGGPTLDAIAFNTAPDDAWRPGCTVRVAYRLDVNEFRNRRSAQLIVEHMQAAAP